MASNLLVLAPNEEDDEFIDIEISSSSSSSPNPNNLSDFEFKMSSLSSSSSSSITSPADELFYKGKLLPLHLPPRLQMVHQILQNELTHHNNHEEHAFHHDFYTTFDSCNFQSYEPFQVKDRKKLNPEEEEHDDDDGDKNQKMTKKEKKQNFSLVSKIRAWFGKVSCKYEGPASSKARKGDNIFNHHKKNGKNLKLYPFGQSIQRSDHRDRFRSFSSRIEFRRSTGIENRVTRSSSSSSIISEKKSCFNGSASFSGLPNKSYGSLCQELEIGNLIMGAIAHCKSSLTSTSSITS